MRLSIAFTLSLALSASAQNASSYATGLLAALQAANLTTLLSVASQNAASLLPLLQTGNHTVFAPTDAAFASLGNSTLANSTLVLDLVSYHLLNGAFPVSSLSTSNYTIAPTALNATGFVNLPGGGHQVVVLSSTNTSVVVHQALSNVTSVASTTYENLVIHVIPQTLTIPGNLTGTASAAGLSSLVQALTTYAPTVVPQLDTAKGLTVFAPANAAFASAASLIGTLNQTQIGNVLANHILNGTVAYSSLLTNGQNVTSASGETLSVVKNATGAYVVSGNVTARIIRSDVLVENGVVHIIDNILANTASNPGAAASAASSAASVGATATGSAGPIGGGGGASGSATGSAAPSATSRAAASRKDKAVGAGLGALALVGAAILF